MLRKFMLSVLIVLLLGLIACGGANSSLKIGWVEQSGLDNINASYNTFTGMERRSVNVGSDDNFSFTYDVNVEQGTLTLRVLDPQDTAVWEETFTDAGAGTVDVPVETAGLYQIEIIGEDAAGSFEVSWQIQ